MQYFKSQSLAKNTRDMFKAACFFFQKIKYVYVQCKHGLTFGKHNTHTHTNTYGTKDTFCVSMSREYTQTNTYRARHI